MLERNPRLHGSQSLRERGHVQAEGVAIANVEPHPGALSRKNMRRVGRGNPGRNDCAVQPKGTELVRGANRNRERPRTAARDASDGPMGP